MNKILYWGKYGFMSVRAHERGEHACADVYVFACGAVLWKDSLVVLVLCVLELYLAAAVTVMSS